MDSAIIAFISLLQAYPIVGIAIAAVIFAGLFMLKGVLIRAMMPPNSSSD